MRIVGKILLSLVALAVVAALGSLLWLRHDLRKKSEEREATLAAALAAHGAEFTADQEFAAAQPAFMPRAGSRDAGSFLNPRLSWQGGDAKALEGYLAAHGPPALELPAEVRKRAQADWLKADPSLWSGLDFSWMRQLASFDYWELETGSPLSGIEPRDWIVAPLPSFLDLLAWAKLRLARGLRENDPAAPAEVEELARLAVSTESMLGSMIGVALLKSVDEARAGKALADAPRDRVKRAVWAAPAFVQLDAPDAVAARFDALRVGRCPALSEIGHFALAARPFLRDSRAHAYARLGRQLEGAHECRLQSLRRAWAAPDPPGSARSICGGQDGGCGAAEKLARVPGLRSLWGEVLLGIATPDWFRNYEKR